MPYDDLYPNPFVQMLRRQQQAQSPLPDVPPEQESSALGRLMEGSLGGLAEIGKILDKTFGGRAFRGALGGNARELLSVLPLSDTLGLTDETQAVQGTDLLGRAGLIDPSDHSLGNQIAGVATEIATDPAMWAGAAVPRLVGRALQGTGRAAGAGVQALTGANPYAYAARQADRVYQGVRAPARALFDPAVAGAWRPEVQPLGEQYTARLNQLRSEAERAYHDTLGGIADTARGAGVTTATQDQMYDALLRQAEGFGPAARTSLASAGVTGAPADDILNTLGRFADRTRDTQRAERAVGAVSKDLEDVPTWVTEANKAADAAGQPLPYPSGLPFVGYQPAEYAARTLAPYGDAADVARRRSSRLGGVSEFQQQREGVFRGIPGGTARVNELARDANFSGQGARLTPLQAEDLLAQELTGLSAVPPGHPALKQAKALAERLRQLPPEALDKGFFSPDVLGSGLARQTESARVVASGETILEGVKRFARPVAELEQAGQRYVRVPDLLDGMGLSHVDATGTPVAKELALHALAPQHGLSTGAQGDLAQLQHLAVPEDVAADMARIGTAWKVPSTLAPVIDFWDRTVGLFKSYLTKVFPAFHTRNLMSGAFNMWRDNALSKQAGSEMFAMIRGGWISDQTAAKLYPGMAKDDATRALRDEMMGNRIAFVRSGQVGERAGVEPAMSRGMLALDVPEVGGRRKPVPMAPPGPGWTGSAYELVNDRTALGDVGDWFGGLVPEKGKAAEQLNPLRVGATGEPNVVLKQADKLGNTVEDWLRGTHYLAKRSAGATPEAAREAVMKYQLNYEDLTQFEKNVMKRLFPWYTFSARSLPPLLEDLALNPAKVAGTMRAITGVRQPGDFVPAYVAEGASVPVPGGPDGQQRYISGFGLPMEDELVKAVGSGLKGDYQRVLQQGFGMMQPFVKLPAELATDTQMFTGRKLEDLRPYEFADLGGALPEDAARRLTQVLANSPASRFASTLNKGVDERKGTVPTAANLLGGVQVTDTDTEHLKDVAARKLLQDLLKGKPAVKTREEVYVPKDKLSALSPDDLTEYSLLKEIEQRMAKRSRERAKEKAGQR